MNHNLDATALTVFVMCYVALILSIATIVTAWYLSRKERASTAQPKVARTSFPRGTDLILNQLD